MSEVVWRHWLRLQILWLFPVGYSITQSHFAETPFEYLGFTALFFVSSLFFLLSVRRPSKETVAIWTAFILFIVLYYIKFCWIVLDPSPMQFMLPTAGRYSLADPSALMSGFYISSIGFTAFCLSSPLLMHFSGSKPEVDESYRLSARTLRRMVRVLLAVIPVLMVGLGYLAAIYDVGFLGISAEQLPFRMMGIIFYARFLLIPGLLLLLIYSANSYGDVLKARMGLLFLLLEGAADSLLRSSRSSLLLPLLTIVFLIAVGGYSPRRVDRKLAIFVGIMALLSIPIITEYRTLRLSGAGISSMLQGLSSNGTSVWEILLAGLQFIIFRIPGIEILVTIEGLNAEPLAMHAVSTIMSPRGIAGYLTVDVYGVDPSAANTFSPSFLGWLFLAGGVAGVLAGCLILAAVATLAWKRLLRVRKLYSATIAQTFALLLLFHALTEGDLESTSFHLIISIGVVFALEALIFTCRHNPRRRQVAALSPVGT